MNTNREEFKEIIKSNIAKSGHHITIVTGGPDPRYGYTIGLNEKFGFELIIAGAIIFLQDDIYSIINSIVHQIGSDTVNQNEKIYLG